MAQQTSHNQHHRHLIKIFILICLINLYGKSSIVEAGSKSSKGSSKTTVIAIDGGSGGAKPHPIPIPWPVVHCHHHHHHMKYVPKPVMVHHWVKKFKYGPDELSASNIYDSRHLMPTMIHENEVPVVIPDLHGPQPTEEVKLHVEGLDSTYEDTSSSRKLKAEGSNYPEPTMQEHSNETIESDKPNHPFSGSNDQELDESRISVNRNPAMSLVAGQLLQANEIEQTKARKILERLLQEQNARLSNIYRDNLVPLHLRGKHALSQAESRSVELMSKLVSQRANYEARKLISRMAERGSINNKARGATGGSNIGNNNSKTNRTFPTSFSAIKNLFGFGSSGGGHNRLSRASIKNPPRQWHVAFGDPMDFSASSIRGRIVAPPPPSNSAKLDIERKTTSNNVTKSSTTKSEFSPHYSLPDLSSYGFGESFGSVPTHMSPPELFKRVPSAYSNTNTNTNYNHTNTTNSTRLYNWREPDKENNLRRPDEIDIDDPLSMIPSYLEFPVTPEFWSEQALKSINAATKDHKFQHHTPYESLNTFANPMASSSDWTSPSMADLNELFEFSAQNMPKGSQTSTLTRDVTSMEQFEAVPSGSTVNPQSSNSLQSFNSLHLPSTGGGSYMASGIKQQSQFEDPSSNSQLRPSPFESNVPLDTSSSFPDPLIESSNELNQMRQFQSVLSQPIANNLTGMVRLSGQLRNPMRTLGATQAAQMPNIPSPPNIPMPGLPAPGMLLQMAGLALPFALARAQRQSNRQPINTAASAAAPSIPRQRLITRALNNVIRRRPRRPSQSSTTSNNSPFSRLTGPQSTRLRSFMQTVRDMSQPSRSKPRTRIKPKMDRPKDRKTRVGRAMESLMLEQRRHLPLDAIPLAVQTDGSLGRFVPVTSPLGELEHELNSRQQVDSFIPPQDTFNKSPLYELRVVPLQQVAQADSSTSQLSNNRNSLVASSNVQSSITSQRGGDERLATRLIPLATASTSTRPEDSSVVEIESQEFGQRHSQSRHRQAHDTTRNIAERSTTESYSFSSTPSSPLPSTVAPETGSFASTTKPTVMRPANYVQALRLVNGLAHTRLATGFSSSTPKVS